MKKKKERNKASLDQILKQRQVKVIFFDGLCNIVTEQPEQIATDRFTVVDCSSQTPQ